MHRSLLSMFDADEVKTNQVQSDPGASVLFASADGHKLIGGHVLAHVSTTRLLLWKGRGEERGASLLPNYSLAHTCYLP